MRRHSGEIKIFSLRHRGNDRGEVYKMEVTKDTDMIRCPVCNANLRYSVTESGLKCEHCGHVEKIIDDKNRIRRDLTDSVMREHEPWKESAVFKCGLCNARTDTNKNEIMNVCPFCGSPNILKTDELPGVKPDSLIPYKVTRQSALDLFKKWIRGKIFSPGKCRKRAVAENINSVFSPTWSFTAKTRNRYDGVLGKDYTVTRTDSKGNTYTTTETRWFNVSGSIDADYYDVLIPSGKLIPQKMSKKLEPYPVSNAVAYRQEYLAGRAAEHYSRDIKTCFSEFEKYIYNDLCQRIKRKHGADHIRYMNIDTAYDTKQFNYILLPNYIANFTYKKKYYNFYVNGATGKVVGRYPLSAPKILLTIAAIGAAIAGLWYLMGG